MSAPKAQILFVDDEQPILNSLKRLFRPTGHRVYIANSGAEGIAILSENDIDIVVSDMRMPEMDGAAFLGQVAEQWPETTRMLLTGYAELSSAIEAINSGSISRYLTKPWQDTDIVMCLDQAIETQRLTRDKNRLEALAVKQNAELEELNESLEQKVAERTQEIDAARKHLEASNEELQSSKEQLEATHEELQASYAASIEVFSRLIQSRDGLGSRASVADDARAVGKAMGLDESECQALYDASLLCDVGKLGMPDELVGSPYTRLDPLSQREYQRHPAIAEAVLVSLEPLASAVEIIGMHCERVDGSGFPNKLEADDIALPAKILAVCKSFVDLQEGVMYEKRMTAAEAKEFIETQKGERFDAEVVAHFIKWLGNRRRRNPEVKERNLPLTELHAGMQTTRDVHDENGVLLLGKGQRISEALMNRLEQLQATMEEPLTAYVK